MNITITLDDEYAEEIVRQVFYELVQQLPIQNVDIRMKIMAADITYKEVAASMGITNCHLSRLMAKELKPMTRERILCAISKCIEARQKAQEGDI